MASDEPRAPTNAELDVLQILWRRGPSTVREVHAELPADREYTATLKVLQVMHRKGLVERDETRKAHTYQAAVPKEGTLSRLAGNLLEKAFGGAVDQLVLHALSRKKTSPEELEKLRRMLDELGEDES